MHRQAHEITGYNPHRMDAHLGPFALPNFKGYFVVQFEQVPVNMKTYGMDDAESGNRAAVRMRSFDPDKRSGACWHVVPQHRAGPREPRSTRYPDGISHAVQAKLRAQWNEKLARIQFSGATDKDKTPTLHGALSRAAVSANVL